MNWGATIRTISTELLKAVSLPGIQGTAILTVLGTLALALFDANNLRVALETGDLRGRFNASTSDLGLQMMTMGALGAAVIGILVVSSEYASHTAATGGGRQVESTLRAMPRRLAPFAAKAVVIFLLVSVLAAITLPIAELGSQLMLGARGNPGISSIVALGWRWVGSIGYWVLVALIAFGIATIARSGLVPMTLFALTTSTVSVGGLATRGNDAAWFLPDAAGVLMFSRAEDLYPDAAPALGAGQATLVMLAWTVAVLVPAYAVFSRRRTH